MKMNMPWKVLNMVKRYAMTTEESLMKNKPKDHVRPSRHSRAKAPITHDLKRQHTHTHTGTGGKSAQNRESEEGAFSENRALQLAHVGV